jgi:hypothetical protein
MGASGRIQTALSSALLALLATSCTLQEVAIVDVEDVVIAEVMVQVRQAPGATNTITAFLHRTIGGLGDGYHLVPDARITITRDDGLVLELAETSLETCVATTPIGGTGSCYWAASAAADRIAPGDKLQIEIVLPSGGIIYGAAQAPGDFQLRDVPDGGYCVQAVNTPLDIRWTPSAGTWAYVNETLIKGLAPVFAPSGLVVDDPLYLLGLSITSADTTIVFPGEFGVFNRFELDRELALALQDGLPSKTSASVSIAATDRNYVNWVRGGNFNPSGVVRVPSLRGDGTGLFGVVVTRSFSVAVDPGKDDPGFGAPSCIR